MLAIGGIGGDDLDALRIRHVGVERAGKPDGLTDNAYIRRYWTGGLELVELMLEHFAFTEDALFREQYLLPVAREVLAFFAQHWPHGADGVDASDEASNPFEGVAALQFRRAAAAARAGRALDARWTRADALPRAPPQLAAACARMVEYARATPTDEVLAGIEVLPGSARPSASRLRLRRSIFVSPFS